MIEKPQQGQTIYFITHDSKGNLHDVRQGVVVCTRPFVCDNAYYAVMGSFQKNPAIVTTDEMFASYEEASDAIEMGVLPH